MGIKKKKSRNYGHKKGLETVEKIIDASVKEKIKYLTLFVFSTENWKRPSREINYLFSLLDNYIDKELKNLKKKDIKINILGNLRPFPNNLKTKLLNIQKDTRLNKKIQINMALNYGSREEIVTTFKKLKKKQTKFSIKNINNNLYTKGVPDPEILIRTGNTNRISNFLIWQIIYSEIFFEKKMWPEFTEKDFFNILRRFKKINRNFGGLSE